MLSNAFLTPHPRSNLRSSPRCTLESAFARTFPPTPIAPHLLPYDALLSAQFFFLRRLSLFKLFCSLEKLHALSLVKSENFNPVRGSLSFLFRTRKVRRYLLDRVLGLLGKLNPLFQGFPALYLHRDDPSNFSALFFPLPPNSSFSSRISPWLTLPGLGPHNSLSLSYNSPNRHIADTQSKSLHHPSSPLGLFPHISRRTPIPNRILFYPPSPDPCAPLESFPGKRGSVLPNLSHLPVVLSPCFSEFIYTASFFPKRHFYFL